MRLTSHIIVLLLLGTSFTTFLFSWKGVIWKIPGKYNLFWHDSVRTRQNETVAVPSINDNNDSTPIDEFVLINNEDTSSSVIRSKTLVVTPIKSANEIKNENLIVAGHEDELVMLAVDRFLETKGGSDILKATAFLFMISTFVSFTVMTTLRKESRWINHTTVLFQVIAFSSISINVVYCLMIYQFAAALNPATSALLGTGFYLALCSMVVSGVALVVTLLELLSEMAVNQQRVNYYETQADQIIVISSSQEEEGKQ